MEEPGRLQSMGSRRVGHNWLSDFTFTFHFHALEKEMAAHSSTLDWRIPGTGAWWAAVYGVTQSWIQLTWLSSSSNLLAKKPNAGLGCIIECWRIDAFELWCWKRLLRIPWTARRSNQSILKEISPECSLEGLMLKLKLQYFGHLMQRIDSLEKILMLGKIEGGRKGRQRMRCWMASPTEWTWVWVNSRSWWWTRSLQRVRHDWATELNWTELIVRVCLDQRGWSLKYLLLNPLYLNIVFSSEHIEKSENSNHIQGRVWSVLMRTHHCTWKTVRSSRDFEEEEILRRSGS